MEPFKELLFVAAEIPLGELSLGMQVETQTTWASTLTAAAYFYFHTV